MDVVTDESLLVRPLVPDALDRVEAELAQRRRRHLRGGEAMRAETSDERREQRTRQGATRARSPAARAAGHRMPADDRAAASTALRRTLHPQTARGRAPFRARLHREVVTCCAPIVRSRITVGEFNAIDRPTFIRTMIALTSLILL